MKAIEPHWSQNQGGFGQVAYRIPKNEKNQMISGTTRSSAIEPIW